MSVALMSVAFKAAVGPTQKLVLLALCDSANDQGECYPSVTTLHEKCSLSPRAVQGAISELEACGYLRRDFRNGRSTVYWMTPAAGAPRPRSRCTPARPAPPQQVHPTPAVPAPLPPQDVHPTPAAGAPITINEPSIEPKTEKKARKRATPPDCPDEVDSQVWADWLAMRAEKRATVSRTVIAGAVTEAGKAGLSLEAFLRVWVLRGSQGLMADWLKPAERRAATEETAYARQMREKYQSITPSIAAKRPGHVIDLERTDVTPRLVG